MKTQPIEVTLGNWGTVRCHNEQHRDYMRAAKAARDIFQSILSWTNAWLYPAQKTEYESAHATAITRAEQLWQAIPDRTNLTKCH